MTAAVSMPGLVPSQPGPAPAQQANGVLPVGKDSDGKAVLVQTTDSTESGLDMSRIRRLIAEVGGG